jgi:hypothetical protein
MSKKPLTWSEFPAPMPTHRIIFRKPIQWNFFTLRAGSLIVVEVVVVAISSSVNFPLQVQMEVVEAGKKKKKPVKGCPARLLNYSSLPLIM